MKKMKCIKTSKSKEGVEWFTEGKEYEVVSENKETGSYLLVSNNGENVKCIRTKRGKNFVDVPKKEVPPTTVPKKVICVKPEPGILTVGTVYDVVKESPDGFEIVSDKHIPYYCGKIGSPCSHFKEYVEPKKSGMTLLTVGKMGEQYIHVPLKEYVKPEETVIEWAEKESVSVKQTVTIEVPDSYNIKSQKVVGHQIVVELEKLKPEFKLGDILTNGRHVWIYKNGNNIYSSAIIAFNGDSMKEGCEFSMDRDVRYANYEERCKFFEALVNAGYNWNSKKLKLSKVEPKPKQNIVVVSSTDTVLTIRPEFLEKLKALGVYDKWLANVKAQYGTENCRPDNWTNWYELINFSFHYSKTPEGKDFWFDIAYK